MPTLRWDETATTAIQKMLDAPTRNLKQLMEAAKMAMEFVYQATSHPQPKQRLALQRAKLTADDEVVADRPGHALALVRMLRLMPRPAPSGGQQVVVRLCDGDEEVVRF